MSPATSRAGCASWAQPRAWHQIRASPSWPRAQREFWGCSTGRAGQHLRPAGWALCGCSRGTFPGCDLIPIPGHTLQASESQDMLPAQTRQREDSTGRDQQGPFCAQALLCVTWGSAARSPVRGLVRVAAVSKQRAPFFPASRGSWCELNTTCLQPLFRATSPIPALGARHWTNVQQERDGPSPTGLGGAAWLCPTTSPVALPRARDVPAEGCGCAG